MNRFAIAAGLLLLAAPAWAQIGGSPTSIDSGSAGLGHARSNQERNKQPVPPPALPGARAEPSAVAPADRQAADLPPTEALFDAINRGDLATAKDAIDRGADINGTNVLGLTPLELSIDLGRNQISFLLLSLRGSNGYNTVRGPQGTQQSAAPPKPTRAERLAVQRLERVQRQQAAATVAPAPAAQTPRLFAGDGGAPAPQAGFLGFGH